MRNIFFPGCAMFVSSFLIVVGLFFMFVFPFLFSFCLNKEFQLSPSSEIFRHWLKTPLPVTLDVYFFNWTNPERLAKDKPAFNEIGPYRFYEVREKINLTWNDNGTLSYRQKRTWTFKEDESIGSLDDVITTVNGVSLTAAFGLRYTGFISQKSLNMAFGFTKQKAWVRKSVGELLFDGYSDDLVTFANTLSPSLTPMTSPYDKFAWFYERNNSYTMDGYFNLDTGANNISNLGVLHNWNYQNRTDFYPGECGRVEGFSGDLFAPGIMRKDTQFKLFSQDLCQRLPFKYFRETKVHGLTSYEYVAGLHNPENDSQECCNGECVSGGFLNLTACRFGAPVFLSFPHFYDSNPLYLNLVDGLSPDPEKHRFSFAVEPTLGVPVDVKARVQLNMYMQPLRHITMYKTAPRLMMPVMWAEQRVRLTSPFAKELRLVLLLPTLALGTGIATLSAGTIICIAVLLLRAKKKPEKEISKKPAPSNIATTSLHKAV